MAITETTEPVTGQDLLGEIRRHGRRRRFEEMLGPQPGPGDAEDLQEFLAFLEEQRRHSGCYPGEGEPGS